MLKGLDARVLQKVCRGGHGAGSTKLGNPSQGQLGGFKHGPNNGNHSVSAEPLEAENGVEGPQFRQNIQKETTASGQVLFFAYLCVEHTSLTPRKSDVAWTGGH